MAQTLDLAQLATLFIGAFLDGFILTCVFVFGEGVFLLAGSLAYTELSIWPIAAIYSGAYLADQLGYGFGRVFQAQFRGFSLANRARRKLVRRSNRLIQKRGIVMIAASRFLGPVAWVTPPLAGSLSFSYRRFAIGSALGVVLAVGQFWVAGALMAYGAEQGGFDPQRFLDEHFWTLFWVGQIVLLALIGGWRLIMWLRLRQE